MKIIFIIIVVFWLCQKIMWVTGYLICWTYTKASIFFQKRKTGTSSEFDKKLGRNDKSPESKIYVVLKNYIRRWIEGYYRYKIIRTGNIASHVIRNFIYYQVFNVSFGKNAIVYYGAEIREPYKLKIGRGSIIGDRAVLDARSGITIGENVNLSSEVQIWTLQHNYSCPYFSTADQCKPVVIKDQVWIGPRVTILPGVTIGKGAVIGAGAVVTKDVNSYTLNGGVPSKQIGLRNFDLKYSFSGQYIPFL